MKNTIAKGYGLMVCVAAMLACWIVTLTGCTPDQINSIAQQAGKVSIVTWFTVDNPTDAQKATAAEVVTVIKTNATQLLQGGSCSSVLYPVIETYVKTHIQGASAATALLAGNWVLTGIDMFLEMYPNYASKSDQVMQVALSFCDGALQGLGLPRSDPLVVAAMRGSSKAAVVRGLK